MKMNEKIVTEIDILGSIEFDLTEAIKDLIYSIKSIKEEVETIKKHLSQQKNSKINIGKCPTAKNVLKQSVYKDLGESE